MRNAAELIRAATATGTYASYVGDGASVPWELIVWPANYILYQYKVYLDSRWPQAFKLHDWCYTPYGQLIQVTKLEADQALFELIFRDSPLDAIIVYNAVRLGPAGVFGNSMTGFPNASRPNIGVAARSFSVPTKCVMIFKDVAGGQDPIRTKIAGWTEMVQHPSDDITTVLRDLKTGAPGSFGGLMPSRALMLPASSSIVGVKLYKGGSGKGASAPVDYPGVSVWPTDIPQMALQMSAKSLTTGATRRWRVRAIPDRFVVNGVYAPTQDFQNSVGFYWIALLPFGFYSKPASSTGFHINTVVQIPPVAPATASTGLVTTIEPHSFIVGDQVTFYSTLLQNGQKYTVTKMVTSLASANQFAVANWTAGNTTGGIVGSPLKNFDNFTLNNFSVGSITVVKVGRPSDQYRGRRSKRRKTA